jgi:hypothetical protein
MKIQNGRRLLRGGIAATAVAVVMAALVGPTPAWAATFAESGTLSTTSGAYVTDSTVYNVGSSTNVTFRADSLPTYNDGSEFLRMRLKNANTGAIFSGFHDYTDPTANYEQIATGTAFAYGKLYAGIGAPSGYWQTRNWTGRIGNVVNIQ